MAGKRTISRDELRSAAGPDFEYADDSLLCRLYDDDPGFRALLAGQITEAEYAGECLMVRLARKGYWGLIPVMFGTG